MDLTSRRDLLVILSKDPYGPDHDAVARFAVKVAEAAQRDSETLRKVEARLRLALTPRYKHLLTSISRQNEGVKMLADMRADLLATPEGTLPLGPDAKELAEVLRDLLSEWFSVGLLHLQRVTWSSPCDLLEKISQYEAVHRIRHWTDIKRRVGPNRRCFVFTHPAMPGEPLVVLHVKLAPEISDNIQSIVRGLEIDEEPEDPKRLFAAVFYSISSSHPGLRGVELGTFLIRSVVHEIQTEFPSINVFSSISPIPGFCRWLVKFLPSAPHLNALELSPTPSPQILTATESSQLQKLSTRLPLETLRDIAQGKGDWVRNEELVAALRAPLMRLASWYLYGEKLRGRAFDAVANFHLRNGASIWRLNWLADNSAQGLKTSCGLMVNYRYNLAVVEDRSVGYLQHNRVEASEQILRLVAEYQALSEL
uniref:Malonyl-CoA decarboxylase n=1 Tax=Eptatretus burgeri TaxID=7764 RepID=A0A8C4R4A7_EPTBU